MALDPSILFQLGKGVTPLMSPGDIQDQQMQRELGSMKLQQARQSMSDDQSMRDIARSTAPEELSGAYFKAGLIKPAQEAQKYQSEQVKSQREAMKAKVEENLLRFEKSAQIMNGVKDQATWDRARQQTAEIFGPEAAAQMPAQYDPELIEQKRAQAMTVKQQLEQKWKEMEYTTPNANARLSAAQSDTNNQRSVGASLTNAAATRDVASATRDAAKYKGDRDTEMKLSDDYQKQSKEFKEVGDAYRLINSTLDKATMSPAATLASATKFMKLLDPGSVVRESELGMALQATGVFDRATNYVNTLARGKVLTKNQVEDFKNITKQIYGAAQEGQKLIDSDYQGKAKQYGLRPEMVTQDLGQNKGVARPSKAIKRTGTLNGRKVVEYEDGSVDYAN